MNKYIFIDLDGTLLQKSSSAIALQSLSILSVIKTMLILFMQGKNYAKYYFSKIANHGEIDYLRFINQQLVGDLIKLKREGYHLILATGSHKIVAHHINDVLSKKFMKELKHDNFFEDIIASTKTYNAVSKKKLCLIKEYLQKINVKEFTYIGNSTQDISIWNESNYIVIVKPTFALRIAMYKIGKKYKNKIIKIYR